MKIDFIVPVKIDSEKRLELLTQSLISFFQNTEAKYVNRLILVDDGSTFENFRSQLSNPMYLKSNTVTIFINQEQKGVGGSKNKGVEVAEMVGKGDMLYFFDGDVYFNPDWLKPVLEAYEENKDTFKLIGAGIHPYLQPRANENTRLLTSHDAVSGWSWFLSYETWEKYGKFADNSLGTGKSEDWEYCQRIRNDGFKVGALINQVVAHCGLTNTEGQQIPGYLESKILAERIAPQALLL